MKWVCVGKEEIDTLHITSWDQDHCNPDELQVILSEFKPKIIEIPGYDPHTESGKKSKKLIDEYGLKDEREAEEIVVKKIDPTYIAELKPARDYGYRDIFYWPKKVDDNNANNNSTVKFFREGSFNVLSTGDVECHSIGLTFLGKILKNELDILILPHHGSKNGCVQKRFVKETKPLLAICSSDFDNQHAHPSEEMRDLFYKHKVKIFTTKTGDVLIESLGNHDGSFKVTNFLEDSNKVSSEEKFESKKKNIYR